VSSLYAEDIPAGSHKIYVWEDGGFGERIDLVCIFQPFRDGGLITGVHGKLTRKIIFELMSEAKKNYKVMYFSRAFGGHFSRFAKFVYHDENGLDYYKVDL
jgi:hypothetical protein